MDEENKEDDGYLKENEERASSFKGRVLWIVFFGILIAAIIACIIVIKVLE